MHAIYQIHRDCLHSPVDCSQASEVILWDSNKIDQYQATTKHSKAREVYIFPGIYSTYFEVTITAT